MITDMPECIRGCAKGLILVLNGFCTLISLAVIGFAAVDLRLLSQYTSEGGVENGGAEGSLAGDALVMAMGFMLLIVSSFGCAGVLKENVKMLYLYVGTSMMLVALELLVGVFVTVQRYGIRIAVTDWIRDDFYKNATGYDEFEHRNLWDNLQSMYECCGLNGPEDYVALGREISLSCCPHAYTARNQQAQLLLYRTCVRSASYHKRGCEDEVLYAIQEVGDFLLGTAVICFWLQAAGILLAMWIANNIRNEVKMYKETLRY